MSRQLNKEFFLPQNHRLIFFILVVFFTFFSVRASVSSQIPGQNSYQDSNQNQHHKIMIMAHKGQAHAIKKWRATVEYLTTQIAQHSFELVPMDWAGMRNYMKEAKADFVLSNPSMYVEFEAKYGIKRLVTLKNKRLNKVVPQFGSVIFKRADRYDINHIKDLKGKHLSLSSHSSWGGWQLSWWEMLQQGFDPYADLGQLSLSNNQAKTVMLVVSGEADAGVCRTDTIERLINQGKIKRKDIALISSKNADYPDFPFLLSTHLYPEWPFAATKNISTELSEQVTKALLDMPADSKAAQQGKYMGWTVADNYQPVHEVLRTLKVTPYEHYGEISFEELIHQYWLVITIISMLMMVIIFWTFRFRILNTQLFDSQQKISRAHRLIEQSLNEFYLFDKSTLNFIDVNSTARNNLAYTMDELKDITPVDIKPEISKEQFEVLIAPLLNGREKELVFTTLHQRKDGSQYPVEVHLQLLEDEQPVFIAIIRDITERLEKETQLTQLNQRLTNIASQVPGVIYQFKLSVDGHYSFPYASKKIQDIYQVTAEQVKEDASLVFDVLYPEDYDKIVESIQESAQTLTSWKLDFRVKYHNGEVRWLYGHSMPGREADGSILWNGFITDITEQKQSEIALQQAQNKYQTLVDDIGDKFVIFSHNGVEGLLSYVSGSLQNIFGISKEDVIGYRWAKSFNWLPDSIVLAESILRKQINGSLDFIQFEMSFIHPDKQIRTINVSQHPARDKSGNLIAIDGIVEDITERKRDQEQIRLSASVFAHSQEGILIADKNNIIVDVNPACLEITGYTREDLIGKTPSIFSADKQTREFYAQMWKILLGSGHWQGEIWNRKKSGEIFSERLSIDVVSDSKGEIQHFVAVFNDITYLKVHEAEMERIAYNDALTGLPNRLLLRDRMQQTLSKATRSKKILAVCFLDLDGFKPVNDTYGHKSGDTILVEVARRLLNTVRADDTVARIGGDEFVLLMQDIDAIGELKQVLERILATISSDYSFTVDEKIQKIDSISASIGVTLYPHDNNEADLLLRHADQAMYQAKQRGKNRYSFFDPKEEQ